MLWFFSWRRAVQMLALIVLTSQVFFAQAANVFSAAQKEEIGKIAMQYLLNHPENLQLAAEKLQQQQTNRAITQMRETAAAQATNLLNDPNTPNVGPQNAKVAVIEFFDYQCIFCARTAPIVEKVVAANPNVRFIFKEFPIFGSRWPASVTAAQNGLTVYAQRGSKAYFDYHNQLFALNKNEGALEEKDTTQLAEKAGVSEMQLDNNRVNADTTLNNTLKLAQALGIMGTPTFIVMPTQNVKADNIIIISGASDQARLNQAISQIAAKA